MSGDPEQEYFADGMVEDIITALSRFKSLFVIARNSSFTYKGKAVDIKQVGRELGVRYVLEGSVRKAGNRVRITGQLIDAATGAHLWADRFDSLLEDIFDLQDRVTSSVIGAIAPQLERAEIERAQRKPTESLQAYDYYLRALASLYRLTRKRILKRSSSPKLPTVSIPNSPHHMRLALLAIHKGKVPAGAPMPLRKELKPDDSQGGRSNSIRTIQRCLQGPDKRSLSSWVRSRRARPSSHGR